jgi:hypothetical protein
MGEPETAKPVGTLRATEVTVPLPPPPPDGVAQVPSFLRNVVVEPVGAAIEYPPHTAVVKVIELLGKMPE